MEENGAMTVIAHIESQFHTKFGIPRQSGLVEELEADVVFEPQFRDLNALRGLEGFSHIWLIWDFSEVRDKGWTPTVRPPRLGGNRRLGVFATRSPFRPNPIGLSCVRLAGIDPHTERGPVLRVRGADLMDGTPIYDIKPYLPYSDCKPEAVGGFASQPKEASLAVDIPERRKALIPEGLLPALTGVLAQDPRPSYQQAPDRIYTMEFGGLEVKFQVEGDILNVCQISRRKS